MRAIRVLVALGLVLGSFAFATPVAAGDPCCHGFDQPPLTDLLGNVARIRPDVRDCKSESGGQVARNIRLDRP